MRLLELYAQVEGAPSGTTRTVFVNPMQIVTVEDGGGKGGSKITTTSPDPSRRLMFISFTPREMLGLFYDHTTDEGFN